MIIMEYIHQIPEHESVAWSDSGEKEIGDGGMIGIFGFLPEK